MEEDLKKALAKHNAAAIVANMDIVEYLLRVIKRHEWAMHSVRSGLIEIKLSDRNQQRFMKHVAQHHPSPISDMTLKEFHGMTDFKFKEEE